MNAKLIYNRIGLMGLLGFVMPLTFSLTAGHASAQGLSQVVFEAPLTGMVDGQPVRKGTAQATLDGTTLRVFAQFSGLNATITTSVGAYLYRGDPAGGGELLQDLASPLGFSGGFETTLTLTPDLLEDLQNGLLYVHLRTQFVSPWDELNGQLQLQPSVEPNFMESPLSHIDQGYPVARGGVRAWPTSEGLRLLGYVNALGSNWQQIGLYRGAPGTVGTNIASFLNFPGMDGLYAGFEHTFPLEAGWEQDLLNGLLYVEVQTSRASDGLRGRLFASTNQAPEASQIVSPGNGETIVIGGTDGTDPVDPDVYLGTISFTPAEDPDGNSVAYFWQASRHPNFANQTITFDLGVDSTRFRLTVADAAALFDALTGRQPGDILLDTPVTVYHRVLTTDGARYTIGEAAQATFIRGTITANESAHEVPGGFTLHGNYPNPFNPTTTVVFDLPAAAEVTVEVFNLLGQRVLTSAPERLAAGDRQRIEVDASAFPSGTYLYRVAARTATDVWVDRGQMTLLK